MAIAVPRTTATIGAERRRGCIWYSHNKKHDLNCRIMIGLKRGTCGDDVADCFGCLGNFILQSAVVACVRVDHAGETVNMREGCSIAEPTDSASSPARHLRVQCAKVGHQRGENRLL